MAQDLNAKNAAIRWPVMIKYSGDDELVLVNDQHEWMADDDLSRYPYEATDFLVDSAGHKYSLQAEPAQRVAPRSTGEVVTMEEAIALIRQHFSVSGACCIAKIHAGSVAECLQMLQQDQLS